ncbi:hypothetical protein [Burkholderia vietnamiensis]|uniref:hypothetical protein n=1 Tax=Burkholderia vietnamiensis TaxID=60552 RepID=UPI001CF43C3B|nr:hypothetical protein [Burkholderia vietnamiensis]MCA8270374.1 hypothetical protein [Burkholderia vietnamiensis]
MTNQTAAHQELTREQKLTLIYRHTHRDFKGVAGDIWEKDAGRKTLMVNENGACVLVLLDNLSDAQIAERLPFALRKEQQRKEKAAAKKAAAQEPAVTPEIPAARIGVKRITVTRGEGPADLCGKQKSVSTFDHANLVLSRWSATAPDSGGYDKCDFEIEFQDGSTYQGRYDLKHFTCATANLAGHVQELALFYTGRHTPAHMTPERHQAFLSGHRETVASYQTLIDKYEIGFANIPAPRFALDQ